jgi:hypothetical protein
MTRRDLFGHLARGSGISKIRGVRQQPLVLEARRPSLQRNYDAPAVQQVPSDGLADTRTCSCHDGGTVHGSPEEEFLARLYRWRAAGDRFSRNRTDKIVPRQPYEFDCP